MAEKSANTVRRLLAILSILLPIAVLSACDKSRTANPEKQHDTEVLRWKIVSGPPVVVTAELLEIIDGNYHSFNLTVIGEGATYSVRSDLISKSLDDAIGYLTRTSGWNDKYLFVRDECTGSNAWRCSLDHVYTIVSNNKLVHVGQVLAGEEEKVGPSYSNGYFRDIYDKFEMNELTSHAGAPAFELVIKEVNGRFVVDRDLTWKENEAAYRQDRLMIEKSLQQITNDDFESDNEIVRALFSNSILSKYCGREAELANDVALIRRTGNKELEATMKKILSRVVPSELPSSSKSRP